MATATNDKPVRLGDLPVVKTNILENARQYDKGVVGGYNGTFPLTAASQGGIYLLPSTGKFYVCETAYNGAQISAPNSNFVELSVWKNHDRLTNLCPIHFSDGIGIRNENSNYLSNTKRLPQSYTGTIIKSGFYIISAIFYANREGGALSLQINNKIIQCSYGSNNVEMPVFYAGRLNKNDILNIFSNSTNTSGAGKNIINIISF